MKAAWIIDTAVGKMTLVEVDGMLVASNFGEYIPQDAQLLKTPFLAQAIGELEQYFAGEREQFTVALAPKGTAFQKSCWEALVKIPYGETRSYLDQAMAIGNPKACRAVGMANNRNPLPIFIPCHRVIGKNGKLVGYGGGMDIKKILLESEKTRKDRI